MSAFGGYYDTDSDPDDYSGSEGAESYYFSSDESCGGASGGSLLADEADDMLLLDSSDSDFSAIDEEELEYLEEDDMSPAHRPLRNLDSATTNLGQKFAEVEGPAPEEEEEAP